MNQSQNNYNNELQHKTQYIESVIKKYLPKEEGFQQVIFEAMNYSLLSGGKRIRPLLMLETYSLFGGMDNSIIEPFMTAIEMIHTYSLVHDDLPAMDNDEYRRGRKTTHVVYGEAIGILTGDALLNYAFELMCGACLQVESNGLLNATKAMATLAKKAGIYGMIGGQVIDINDSGVKSSSNLDDDARMKRLIQMYHMKTSALIEASMMIGAIMADANDEQIVAIEQVARDIGLAFQIQDDILDLTSSLDILGKATHSDEKNEKTTYVTLRGLEDSKEDVASFSKRSLETIHSLDKENIFLKQLIQKLITREK